MTDNATAPVRRKGLDWSARGWPRVYLIAVLGSLACAAIALYVDHFNYAELDADARMRAILTSTFVPIALAGPLMFYFLNKIRLLAITQEQLRLLATTDSLTGVLSRGAFTALVEGYLAQTREAENTVKGALLVVDVDDFKRVNDSFGHDKGDNALRLIATSMRDMLRGTDIVGRLGGEEFGIFLPGADGERTTTIAERVRVGVANTEFAPNGTRHHLTVNVGGAVFRRRYAFAELYRLADRNLYAAKAAGRDRIAVAPAELSSAA